jgi:thiopeptide-type bacteriocin biosynthesis protein
MMKQTMTTYQLLPALFLRAPFYSFRDYSLARLPEVLGRPGFRNALRLASPGFYQLLENKEFVWERLGEKERHTLGKYYNRMCFRPTPFGSFASFTLLAWADGEPVQLADAPETRLHLLPDQPERLAALRRPLSAATPLVGNPTLYRLGKSWRYYRSVIDEKGRYRFGIQEMDAVRFNNDLLRLFRHGPVAFGEVLGWVARRSGAASDEARDYLDYLLEDQVLYAPGQGTIITEEQPLSTPVPGTAYYAALERPLVSGGPGEEDRAELAAAIGFLQRFAPPGENPDLARFITDFTARFDRQKVSLLEALDPDTGITFGDEQAAAPGLQLLEGIPFVSAAAQVTPAAPRISWTPLQQLLLKKWDRHGPLVLADSDLDDLPEQAEASVPNTLAVIFRKSAGQLVLEQAAGASATQLIGRFSVFSGATATLCRDLAAMEAAANPGVLFADIGQLSDTHIDNINRRAPIYPYEIPVNVCSALPAACQLPPGDLLLSVRGGELILESRALGKRVVPRLATAYNYHHTGLSLFCLLCSLSYQGLTTLLSLDPERLFPGLPYYPRIVYGHTVLSPARWRLDPRELEQENGMARHGLPRYVALGDTDQQLVFDLSDQVAFRFLLKCTEGKKTILLQEYLLPDGSVRSGDEPCAGQFVAFLAHDRPVFRPLSPEPHQQTAVPRAFPPGSDWLYLKIYCTGPAADRVLQEVIAPVVRRHRRLIRSWFFIRYADPGHHLRLRIRLAGTDAGRLLVALHMQLRRSGLSDLVRDFQADTYRRELERYGPGLIGQAEEVFRAGSELVAAFGPGDEVSRFRLGVRTAWEMTRCFYPGTDEQAAFTADCSLSYREEFGKGDKQLKVSLDKKYRSLKNEIDFAPQPDLNELLEQLRRLSAMAAGKSPQVRRGLLADLIHMQLNRTFFHSQRQQELLVYHCLHKHLLRPDHVC